MCIARRKNAAAELAQIPDEGQLADVIRVHTDEIPEHIVDRLCAATRRLVLDVQRARTSDGEKKPE